VQIADNRTKVPPWEGEPPSESARLIAEAPYDLRLAIQAQEGYWSVMPQVMDDIRCCKQIGLNVGITAAYKLLKDEIQLGERPYTSAQIGALDRLKLKTIVDLSQL
jgi:hypothetical protein